MNHLNMYSTVVGELPKLVRENKPMTFIPYEDVVKFKEQLKAAYTRKDHTAYENEQWVNFLLYKIGMK